MFDKREKVNLENCKDNGQAVSFPKEATHYEDPTWKKFKSEPTFSNYLDYIDKIREQQNAKSSLSGDNLNL